MADSLLTLIRISISEFFFSKYYWKFEKKKTVKINFKTFVLKIVFEICTKNSPVYSFKISRWMVEISHNLTKDLEFQS